MTALANEHGAVNLAQGFPDFDGPSSATDAAIRAIQSGHAQYSRMQGIQSLNESVALAWAREGRGTIDPERHVTITSGCSEGIVAAFLGLLNPGDEVVIFEPYFDFYVTAAAIAGATPRFVLLHPSDDPEAPGAAWWFDEGDLRRAFTARTRAVVVNTPHNPTGKVYTREELSLIADLATRHNAVVITDEVYEHLTYEPSLPHVSIATLPDMWDRTITLSSLAKTFSLTGWKVGWAVACEALTACVRAAHQFLTFCAATPLQHGAASALADPGDYPAKLRSLYARNRDRLSDALRRIGIVVYPSHATYFLMADHGKLGFADDREFCTYLTTRVGVAAIPPSVFYSDPARGRRFARFAFCKRPETIQAAIDRLSTLKGMPDRR
jgi:aspartate/methionine/tyrosine aminotransferase